MPHWPLGQRAQSTQGWQAGPPRHGQLERRCEPQAYLEYHEIHITIHFVAFYIISFDMESFGT